jgi:P4 family phage/plasmid primase-like protien|tara:strand:- start:2866 stop:5229 length:2364 start_codon:yes stop_codon:yes gene_type:complete
MTVDIQGDTAAAVDFLGQYTQAIGTDRITLVAIVPDGFTETRTFDVSDASLAQWIDGYQGKRNLYFTVNEVKGRPSKKPGKADMARAVAVWVDIDPQGGAEDFDAERSRIFCTIEGTCLFSVQEPSFLIDSGGGYQAFWLLEDPIDLDGKDGNATRQIESLGKQLEDYFRADHCRNIDRIMRLPGTINLPNRKKIANGRKPALAKLEWFKDIRYSTADLSQNQPLKPPKQEFPDEQLAKKLDHALTRDAKLRNRWNGSPAGLNDKTRSSFDMSMTAMLLRHGFSKEETTQVLCRAFKYGKGAELDDRQIDRMWERCQEGAADNAATIADFDEEGFVFLRTGSDVELAHVARESLDAEFGDIPHTEGKFWRYAKGCWSAFPDHELRTRIHTYDGNQHGEKGQVRLNSSRIKSILTEMAAMAAQPDLFDNAPAGINCASGFIAFDKGGVPELLPHDGQHRARHMLPGRWSPGAPWHKPGSLLQTLLHGCFLGDSDHAEKVDFLAELCGAAALGYATKITSPKAVILHGATAENGKSQVLDLIRGVLPKSAIAAIAPGKFSDNTMIVQLVGKHLNATDELSGAVAIAGDAFKAVVTGDVITGRDVYQPAMTFRPIALQVHATNNLPPFSGGFDRGVRRRLAVLEFSRTVPANERIPHIGSTIANEEGDLLLAFAVEGAQRLIERGSFGEPPSSQEALNSWILGADPVDAWFRSCAEIDPQAERKETADVYRLFRHWAINQGFDERRLPAVNNFTQRLMSLDSGISNPRDSRARYIKGIRIVSTAFDRVFP